MGAPELLCGASRYGPPIDMWSAGCVLGELLARKPLFAGKTTKDQLKIIVKQLGKPTGAKIREFEKKYEGFNTEGQLDKLPAGTTRDWSELITGTHDQGLMCLLSQILTFPPANRLSAS